MFKKPKTNPFLKMELDDNLINLIKKAVEKAKTEKKKKKS